MAFGTSGGVCLHFVGWVMGLLRELLFCCEHLLDVGIALLPAVSGNTRCSNCIRGGHVGVEDMRALVVVEY